MSGVIVTSPEELARIVREQVDAALAEHAESKPVAKEIIGPTEMAKRLDVSRTTLHRLRHEGCPAVKLGDIYKFCPPDVLAWVKARGQ